MQFSDLGGNFTADGKKKKKVKTIISPVFINILISAFIFAWKSSRRKRCYYQRNIDSPLKITQIKVSWERNAPLSAVLGYELLLRNIGNDGMT